MKKISVSVIVVTYNRKEEVLDCLESIFGSDYKDFELILVDNASTDGTIEFVKKTIGSRVKIIKSETNLMAGGGRNLGATYAKGKYLLFIDSDNVIGKRMISELVENAEKIENWGILGPLMYYFKDKKRIWWADSRINLWTSKTYYIGLDKTDNGQFNQIAEVGHIPNVFMLRRDLWEKVGGIDKDYIIHYEESDLAERIRRIGLKLYRIPSAKTWHKVPLYKEQKNRSYFGENQEKTYYVARNRILFMKKNTKWFQYVFFLIFYLPLFSFFYLTKIVKAKRMDLIKIYFSGLKDGIL